MWGDNEKHKLSLNQDENFTFLGRGVDFNGVISFEGTVRIDGRLKGEIQTKGTLIVGEHAVIKGIISAGTLICGGKINGNITATEKVELIKPAIVVGDIHAPAISIEEGVHFHGMCDMGAEKWTQVEGEQDVENVHDLAAHREHRGKVRVQEHQP